MNEPAKFNNVVSFLWAIADLLNGAFQKSEFQKIILMERFNEKSKVDLRPAAMSNHETGYVFEHLLRKFNEALNQNPGEHFTPREVIRLMVDLVLMFDTDLASGEGVARTVHDCCCGTGGMTEAGRMNYEGRKRPQRPDQAIRLARHPLVRKPAQNDGSPGAGQTTAALGNVRRSELPRSSSWPEQSRIHRQMRRLTARTGRVRLLAGTARRWRDRNSGQAAAASCRVRRTDRNLRHDHQTSEGFGLTGFHPSSFNLQTSPAWAIARSDMLKAKDGEFFFSDWLRNGNTVELPGIWESVFNPALKINLTLPQHHE